MPTSTSGPDAQPPQAAGQAVGPRVELAVGQGSRLEDHRDRLRRPRRLRREELVDERLLAGSRPAAGSTRPASCCRSGGRQQRQLRDPPRRARPTSPASSTLEVPGPARDRRARRRAPCCRPSWPTIRAPGVERRQREVELRAGHSSLVRAPASAPAAPGVSGPARSGSDSITWKSGARLRSRSGASSSTSRSNGTLLVRVGAPGPPRAPGSRSSRERSDRPPSVAAQDQRVDEEADQPLDLARGRGRRPASPTATSLLAGEPREQRLRRPRAATMKSVAPLRAAPAPAAGGRERLAASAKRLHRPA